MSDDEAAWVADHDDVLRPARKPSQVGDLARAIIGRRGWGDRLEGAAIFGRWEEIVGPELARRCEPVTLAGGLLVVRAESAAWATQVSYLQTAIVQRADEVLRPGLVRGVKVTVGPLQGGSTGPA